MNSSTRSKYASLPYRIVKLIGLDSLLGIEVIDFIMHGYCAKDAFD